MNTLGQIIRQARKENKHSQRSLAELAGLSFTYLSKLENDRTEYPPKESVIRKLADCLGLNAEELIFLTGRIPEHSQDFLRQHHKALPALFRQLRQNPSFAQEVFEEATAPDV